MEFFSQGNIYFFKLKKKYLNLNLFLFFYIGRFFHPFSLYVMGTTIGLGSNFLFFLQSYFPIGLVVGYPPGREWPSRCNCKSTIVILPFTTLSNLIFYLLQAFYLNIVCLFLDVVNVGVFFPSRSGINIILNCILLRLKIRKGRESRRKTWGLDRLLLRRGGWLFFTILLGCYF